MAEAWEQWHGEVIGGEFRLRQYLGGSDHSAVFLADRNRDSQPVVLKFVPSHPATADSQTACWEQLRKLSHPYLLHMLSSGRCQLGNSPFLYAVIERADENLAQILPQRALTQRETGDMLRPVLDALDYLHKHGFAHGHIAPSNILAVGDQIKLSSDTASATAQVAAAKLDSSANDLPLSERAGVSKTADIWSLGATLVEVLTQRRTAWEETSHGEPLFREKLPDPFREIAKRCLNRDPARRPSVEEIRNLLESPVAEERPSAPVPVKESGSRRGILIAVVAAVVLLAIVGWTKRSSRGPQSAEIQQAPQKETPRALPEPQPETAPEPHPQTQSKPAVPPPTREPSHEMSRGAVVHEVIPTVAQSARNTITGKVRVVAKVDVDTSGNITDVTLDSPGPSKYFARLASEAARQWKFTPPRVNGHDVASEWLLRFAFGRTETTVSPTQAKP
jgi:TonB family protein